MNDNRSTQISYSNVVEICDRMIDIISELNEEWEKISQIINEKDSIWKGTAADKYFLSLKSDYEKIYEATNESGLISYIEAVKQLVENNKILDREISDKEIQELNEKLPNISSIIVDFAVSKFNSDLANEVKANGNITSQINTGNADALDEVLLQSVKTNNNITSQASTSDAQALNSELLQSVKTNNNITSQASTSDAQALNSELLQSVKSNDIENGSTNMDFEEYEIPEELKSSVKIDDSLSGMGAASLNDLGKKIK